MSWDLVIFDCDGVLVDSEPTSNRILSEMLHGIGLPMNVDETVHEFVGRSMDSCLRIIERRLGHPAPPGFCEQFDRRVFEAFRAELRAVEGIEEVLERIPYPFCAASSGSHAKMRTTLGITDLLPLFEGKMFSATEVERGKPYPDLFLHAAAELAADPARCVVVEDTARGVEAGVTAGMSVFGYVARSSNSDLELAGARCFTRMSELPSLLDAAPTGFS
jgi:HAD superfamily hydrolase (TIGR01509 family)